MQFWALVDRKRVLGTEHSNTLSRTNALVRAHFSQGKHEAAKVSIRQVSKVLERIIGKIRTNMLASFDSSAIALKGEDKYLEAEKRHWGCIMRIPRRLLIA
jgi:ribosome biogenesis protein Nip4